jgi:type III restriction enzyme
LEHIQKIQRTNQIAPSPKLDGRFNLTIEMETGERVIIVMGALNVILSRVSGTLTKYYSYIA